MTGPKQIFGKQAEDLACNFLQNQGYVILERNFRTRFSELDIIARHGDTLVFLEVKARKTLSRGTPREAITPVKQQRIVKAASWYLAHHRLDQIRVRFDVVAIVDTSGKIAIDLIQNAFQVD
ncbi:MAG: YraN family protein [Pseudomonadota bacterium]